MLELKYVESNPNGGSYCYFPYRWTSETSIVIENFYLPRQETDGRGRNLITVGPGRFQTTGDGLSIEPPQGDNAKLIVYFGYYRNSSPPSTMYYTLEYTAPSNAIEGKLEIGNAYIKLNDSIVATGTTYTGTKITMQQDLCFLNSFNWSWNYIRGAKCGKVSFYENGVLSATYTPYEDDNGVAGYYDENNGVMIYSNSDPWVSGPDASSIVVRASKTSLAATGETININVSCENAWTLSTSGDNFLVFSETGDTGSTTITATAPSYTGATAREEYITFADSVTGDIAELTIKQKKYTAGQPFYLGADEIVEIYLGDDEITEAYLGEDLVFSSSSPEPPTGGSVSISIAYAADGPASANTYYLYSTDHMTGALDEHHYILATATIVKDENEETYMTASAITDTGITSVVWDNPNSNLIFTGEFDTGYTYAVRYQGLDATDNKWYYGNCYDENSGDDTFTGDTNVSFVLPDFTDAGEYVKQLIITGFTGSDEQVYDYDGKFDFIIDDMGEEMVSFYECDDEDVVLPPCPFSCVYDDTAHTLTVVARWEEDTSYFIISKSPSDAGCVQYVNEISWSEGEYTVTMGYGDGDEEPIDGCGE